MSSSLRILHLGKYYPPVRGGIETVVETLCGGATTWAESQVLVLNKDRSTVAEKRGGVAVRRVGSVATIGAVSLAPTLPFWLARAEADVMVLHEPNPMGLVAYYLARPQIPLIVWYHSEVVRAQWKYRLFYQPFLDFALGRAQRIVVASPPMLDVPALTCYRNKCVVVPFGLRVDRYVLTDAVAARVSAIQRGTSRPMILFVGRLVGYKGLDVLLDAVHSLDADVVIVGDGAQRVSLQAKALALGIADRVRFVGEATNEDLLAWYHACDVFVLPSVTRQEAFGMVQLEAMLCGCPIVSTELGTGVSWVNQHDCTGLVVRPGDARELRNALARLLGDADLRGRLGAEARSRVLEHFTAERMCNTTRLLYQDVSQAAPQGARVEPATVA
jgi:rhamnosyl/mannosyltransferase